MEVYHWVTLGLGGGGFVATWVLGAFKLGRAVEQMRAGVREEIEEEREKVIAKITQVQTKFDDDLSAQEARFREVGLSVRQYIADVEKKLVESELWNRDNFVRKTEFEKAVDGLTGAIQDLGKDIKADLKEMRAEWKKN